MLLAVSILLLAGCAKYNTYFNAKKSFDSAEHVRDEAIKQHKDPPKPTGTQKTDYDTAIRKAQKVLDEYPGNGLTDDALFLQAKSYYRLESYRMSIRKFDLLFTNFPKTPYMEEALYLTAMDYLLIGAVDRSQEYLDRLAKLYPKSKYQAETRKVSGDNSFALEDWAVAAENYRAYLDLESEIQERDRIGLRLAECYWELKDYVSAAEVLQEVSANTSSADLAFQAKILRARVHVKMGDFEVADALLAELRDEASIYSAQGEVQVIEAESLVAQGKSDEAPSLLENMPVDWETPVVKARASDLLGYIYVDREDYEEARTRFQTALLRRDELDDPDRTRRLNDNLQDYLAAEAALPDARPERIPTLKLLQANAMLFGFEKSQTAASLYIQAAADTAADSTVAARALYGAYLTYDSYLDKPDSGAIFSARLEKDFPESPQAFEIRSGTRSNLLEFLLARQDLQQQERFANLSDEERGALQAESDFSPTEAQTRFGLPGVRRRMVYLSRRPNLVYPPPEAALQAAQVRQIADLKKADADIAAQAAADSIKAAGAQGAKPGTVVAPPDSLAGPAVGETAQGTDEGLQEQAAAQDSTATQGDQEEKDKEDDKKKKKDDNWDFLR